MSISDSLALRLRETYFTLRRSAQHNLADTGATVDQVVVLTLLAEEDGLTQQDLVERAFSDPSTIRQLMVLLEKRGWIRREPCPDDGRAKLVFLTAEGRKQQRRLKRIGHIGNPAHMEDLLTAEELRIVMDCLDRIIEAQPVNWRAAASFNGKPQASARAAARAAARAGHGARSPSVQSPSARR